MDEVSETGERVDAYLEEMLLPADPVLVATLADSSAAGLPAIAVSPLQGRLLEILVRGLGARRVLEVGTLGGYSTTCMARALPPGGRVVTCEVSPRHAEVARANLVRAGLIGAVEVRVGPALETLAALASEDVDPFDVVFIDADKQNSGNYLLAALPLTRPGTLVLVDNVVREGRIARPGCDDPDVVGSRHALDILGHDPRFRATALQTVGAKGYDGFAVALVGEPPEL